MSEAVQRELTRTYAEPKNHLFVPRRSERAAIASRYWVITAGRDIRVPHCGSKEKYPVNGAGGGVNSDARGCLSGLEGGKSSVWRYDGFGCDKIYVHARIR
jgi:hypothetical protein